MAPPYVGNGDRLLIVDAVNPEAAVLEQWWRRWFGVPELGLVNARG
jgi:hypothetical protein